MDLRGDKWFYILSQGIYYIMIYLLGHAIISYECNYFGTYFELSTLIEVVGTTIWTYLHTFPSSFFQGRVDISLEETPLQLISIFGIL